MTTYAVTGVTGKFGRIAIERLAELVPQADIIALARNIEKVQAIVPVGIEVRPGDYDQVEQLAESLTGVDRLLFVSSQPGGKVAREDQHKNMLEAAKRAGVTYIAYTSFPHADTATTPLASDHQKTEMLIKQGGFQYSFLRNNWYFENELSLLKNANEGKSFVHAGGDGRVGWALESEYAQAAANVLVDTNAKKIYEFAGVSRTYADLAQAVDGQFDLVSLDLESYKKELVAAGLPEGTVGIITMIQALIRDNQLNEETNDLVDVLKRPLVSIHDAVQQILR